MSNFCTLPCTSHSPPFHPFCSKKHPKTYKLFVYITTSDLWTGRIAGKTKSFYQIKLGHEVWKRGGGWIYSKCPYHPVWAGHWSSVQDFVVFIATMSLCHGQTDVWTGGLIKLLLQLKMWRLKKSKSSRANTKKEKRENLNICWISPQGGGQHLSIAEVVKAAPNSQRSG